MSNEESNSLNHRSGDVIANDCAAADNLDLFAKAKTVLNYLAPERFCSPCKIARGTEVDDQFGIEVERKLIRFSGSINRILARFHRLDFVICKDNGSDKDFFVDVGAHTIFIDSHEIDCFTLAVHAYFIQLGYHVRRSQMEVNFSDISYFEHSVDGPSRHLVITTAAYQIAHPDTRLDDLNWALKAPGFIRPIDHQMGRIDQIDAAEALRDYLHAEADDVTLVAFLDHPLDSLRDYYDKRVNGCGFCFSERQKSAGRHEIFVHTPEGDKYRAACDYIGYLFELMRDCRSQFRKEPSFQCETDSKSEYRIFNLELRSSGVEEV